MIKITQYIKTKEKQVTKIIKLLLIIPLNKNSEEKIMKKVY